ncbi:MAG: molybdenum cofactor guanylyltransferase MobA [Halarcobacter sp.]
MLQKPFDIPCVILSGGRSSRMGEDKALLPFGNHKTLIQYQYDRLKPYFKKTYISSKIDKFDFLKNSDKDEESNIIYDDSDIYSPIVALKKILESIESQKVFIITVDSPFVKIESISKLIKESKNFDITVAKTFRIQNLCGVFDKSNLFSISQMLENNIHKVGYLQKNCKVNIIRFADDMEFLNLNRKEDYELAKYIISYIYN